MKNISVIGAGTMGNGIAHTFAQKGFNVNLVDISANALEKAISTIGKNLDRMVQKEKITEQEKSQTLSNITTFTNIITTSIATIIFIIYISITIMTTIIHII